MREILAELEHLVLLAVLRLDGSAYGISILGELADTADRRTTKAAVYVALRHLEDRGFVSSRLSPPTARRGGRAKRYYSVEEPGLEALRQQQGSLTRMWAGLEEQFGS